MTLVKLPPKRNQLTHRNAQRYKAQLVAKGFTQKFGEDYDEAIGAASSGLKPWYDGSSH